MLLTLLVNQYVCRLVSLCAVFFLIKSSDYNCFLRAMKKY